MPTIQEIRQQYPQYNDMNDQQLADSLHAKFYSDMPKEQFYSKVGLGSSEQNETAGNYWHNPITRGLADVAAGMTAGGIGIHNAPYNLVNMVSPKAAQSLPAFLHPENAVLNQDQASGVWGINDPGIADKIVQGAAQYAPYGIAGGTSVLGQTLGGAAAGATQSDNPLMGAAEGAGGAALTMGALKSLPLVSKGISNTIKQAKNIPEFFNTSKNTESLKDALSPESIANIENKGHELYNAVTNEVGEKNIIHDPKFSAYLKYIEDDPSVTKGSIARRNKDFIENSSFNNAHKLQDALGDRIRAYDIIENRNGALDSGKDAERQALIDARKSLHKDMYSFLNIVNPSLSDAYYQASKNWATNVEPWIKSAQTLRDLGAARSAVGLSEDPGAKAILNTFAKKINKSESISENRPSKISPVPQEIQQKLMTLKQSVEGRNALLKLIGGAGAVGTTGLTLKHFLLGGL